MLPYCADPALLDGLPWLACYLTTGGHLAFYSAFGTVLLLLAVTAPAALLLGFGGAAAARSPVPPVAWLGKGYIAIVRGVPDIAFFLFFVIALDQGFEWLRHQALCPDWTDPIRQGIDFLVCPEAKLPQGSAPQWVHEAYGMTRAQTFRRIIVPQMWVYALPGLGNLWMVLIKATPLLFLLGVEDIVYWARELGASKTARFSDYPHPDWRVWYFGALLVFYLAFTRVSEVALERITRRLSRGQGAAMGADMQRGGA
jgi:polar amino acid transport system permease protein